MSISNMPHETMSEREDKGYNISRAVSETAEKGQSVAATAVDKTNEALHTVGEKMASMADTIRQKAPHEGAVGSAACTLADNLQAGGRYLQQHGLQDMAEDVTSLIRR